MVLTRSQKRVLEGPVCNDASAVNRSETEVAPPMARPRGVKRSTASGTDEHKVVKQRKRRRSVAQNQTDRFTQLPVDILFIIFNLLPAREVFTLELTCRRLAQLLSEQSPDGAYFWAQKATLLQLPDTPLLSRKHLFSLVSLTGCQLCHRPRTRKVFWMFLIRCCDDCFQERTVRHYNLDRKKLKREYAFLPSVTGEGYSTSRRELCYYDIYWQPDLVDEVPTEEELQAREVRLEELRRLQSDMTRWESQQASAKREAALRHQTANQAKIAQLVARIVPPAEEDVLQRCKAYRNAMKKQDEMTKRSLTLLENKLPKEVQQAREEIRQFQELRERRQREYEAQLQLEQEQRRARERAQRRDQRIAEMIHKDIFSPDMGFAHLAARFPLRVWLRYSRFITDGAINAGVAYDRESEVELQANDVLPLLRPTYPALLQIIRGEHDAIYQCLHCNNDRMFISNGIRDHMRMVHGAFDEAYVRNTGNFEIIQHPPEDA
ncbi:hypothetical protein BCR43DRAFT_498600 [Syncephalastrum racemosum]|uniref:F-box domain-containing protein n=1 Tax=Syncephalastrum racemosum TaxID=13706 RepID=A0A1X2H145_SYNRA|nr:hypothetical protein BCR43DRAFT_498600 [Syncephalastrum racemosum]